MNVAGQWCWIMLSVLMEKLCISGSCRGSGKKPGPHGLHLCWVPAVPHPRVSGGVEYGEPGGDLPRCHCRVSVFNVLSNINAMAELLDLYYCLCRTETCCPAVVWKLISLTDLQMAAQL